jgi:hypothetical protein
VLVINSLVVSLSLPRGRVLGKEAKHFLKEVEAQFWLPACCSPPIFDSPELEVGAVSVF